MKRKSCLFNTKFFSEEFIGRHRDPEVGKTGFSEEILAGTEIPGG